MKYAFAVVLAMSVVLSVFAYFQGYETGKKNQRLKIITKEVEVIRYVEKERAKIHSVPNAGRDELIRMFNSGVL